MTADTVGDVWTYALDLAQALQPYSIDIALAIMGPPLTTQQRAAVQQLQNVTIYESTCKLEWMEGSWDDVEAAGAWLLELEALTQPDVVHLNGYAHGALHLAGADPDAWPCVCLFVVCGRQQDAASGGMGALSA
jgi:hypothetical protein